jgi:hypothetical protein
MPYNFPYAFKRSLREEGQQEEHQSPTGGLVSLLTQGNERKSTPCQTTGKGIFYRKKDGNGMDPSNNLPPAVIDLHRAALSVLAANMQPDPKKQGKEKKPGTPPGKSRFPV